MAESPNEPEKEIGHLKSGPMERNGRSSAIPRRRPATGTIGLAVLCIVVLLAAAAGFLAFDVGGVTRAGLTHAMSRAFQRVVDISGPVSISWSGKPEFSLTGLRILHDEVDDEHPILTIEKVQISISLADLIGGNLVLPETRVSGLLLHLRRPAGMKDWRGLSSTDKAGGSGFIFPILGLVDVERAQLAFVDETSGERLDILVAEASLYGTEDLKTADISAVGIIQNRPFKINGQTLQPRQALEQGTPFPFNLELTSELLTASARGHVDPFAENPTADINFEATAYAFQELIDPALPALSLNGIATVAGRLSGTLDAPSIRDLNLQVLFEGGGGLHLSGSVDNALAPSGLDLAAKLEIAPPRQWMDWFPNLPLSPAYLSAESIITGDPAALAFENLQMRYEDQDGMGVDVSARAKLGIEEEALVDLRCSAELRAAIPDFRRILGIEAEEFPQPGETTLIGAVSIGRSRVITLSDMSAKFANFPGVTTNASGQLGTFDPETGQPSANLDLVFHGSVANAGKVANVFTAEMPFLTTVAYQANVMGIPNRLAMKNIDLTVITSLETTMEIKGAIDEIVPHGAKSGVRGISLDGKAKINTVREIARWQDFTMPDIGPISATFRATGNNGRLRLQDILVRGGIDDEIDFRASGHFGHIDLTHNPPIVGDMDIRLTAAVSKPRIFSKIFGIEPPLVKSARLEAHLVGPADAPSLEDLRVEGSGDAGLTFFAVGRIEDLIPLAGVAVQIESTIDPAQLASDATPGALGRIEATGSLVDEDGSLGLENLSFRTTDTALWTLHAAGTIDNLRETDEIDLRTRMEIHDPQSFAAAVGFEIADMRAVAFDGTLGGSDEEFKARGKFDIGTTAFRGEVQGKWTKGRPILSGQIESDMVDLIDLGFNDIANPKAPQKVEPTEDQGDHEPIFSDQPFSLDFLGLTDLDLELTIEEVRGMDITIDRLSSRIRLGSGILDLDPTVFEFGGGKLQTRLRVEVDGQKPRYKLSAHAENLGLETGFETLGADVPLDGQLYLSANLMATGDRARSIANTVAGDVDIAIENGYVRTGFFDLLGKDLFSWLLSPGSFQGKTRITCFVMRLDAHDGRADLTNFVLDTPGTRVGGNGRIEFRRENMDLTFVPKPKTRLIQRFSTPIKVTGRLDAPSLRFNPLEITEDTIGKIVFSPLTALSGFVSRVTGTGTRRMGDCRT